MIWGILMEKIKPISYSNKDELNVKKHLIKMLKESPIPEDELLENFFLYTPRQYLTQILVLDYLYKQILDVHGIIIEFGVRWGKNLTIMQTLRGIYEPYNYNRKIVGFDTFEGFQNVNEKDGTSNIIAEGSYSVTKNYEEHLSKLMSLQEQMNPISHMTKFELIKGDASIKICEYLKDHPETIISFVYFDFNLYKPTKDCLEAIKPHLTKGSILCFDELNHENFPGETIALKEVFSLDSIRIQRTPYSTTQSFVIIE
jgi:hypothetical protein